MTAGYRMGLTFVLSSVVVGYNGAFAGGFGISASPAKILMETKPASVETYEINLYNESAFPVKVDTYAWDLWYGKNDKAIYGPPGSYSHSAAPWITTIPKSLVLGPNGKEIYKINVSTPVNAQGGHYAIVFAEVKPLDPTQGRGVNSKSAQVGLRLGTVIYQTTVGKSKEVIKFKKTSIEPPTSERPMNVRVEILNMGDTWAQPKVTARIVDSQKRTVARLNLELPEEQSETLFPGQTRTFIGKYSGELSHGKHVAILTTTFGRQGLQTIQVPFEVR